MRTLVERKEGLYDAEELVVPRLLFRPTTSEGTFFLMRGKSMRFWSFNDGFGVGENYYHLHRVRLDNEGGGTTVFEVTVSTWEVKLRFAGLQSPRFADGGTRLRLFDGEQMVMERIPAWRDSDLRRGIEARYETSLPPLAAEGAALLLAHWPGYLPLAPKPVELPDRPLGL